VLAQHGDFRPEHIERQAHAHHHGWSCRVRARSYS
jgi:hypothetical protein